MFNSLSISLIQPNTVWHDTKANIDLIDRLMEEIHDSHMIILPEMWNTGFSMSPEGVATTMDGDVVRQMQSWAKRKSAIVGGSVIIKEKDKYYNRFLLVSADGPVASYDKKHLFTLAGEHKSYTAGKSPVTQNFYSWDIHLNICYDLRFPVWSRRDLPYDLLIYTANWPAQRHHAWRTLLQARAIENQCYVIGTNRVGIDINDHKYLGGSAVINYNGHHILEMNDQEGVGNAQISKSELLSYRSKLNFLSDRDHFILTD